jgi:hypothetical protein
MILRKRFYFISIFGEVVATVAAFSFLVDIWMDIMKAITTYEKQDMIDKVKYKNKNKNAINYKKLK